MGTIQVKLFDAGTGQQNDYGKTFISFVGIVDTILHLEFCRYNCDISSSIDTILSSLASGGLDHN